MAEVYDTLMLNGNFAKVLSTPSFRMLRFKFEAVWNQSKRKLSFLFGHNTNILPWLTLMNLTSVNCLTEKWKGEPVSSLNCVSPPAFAANLIAELH